MTTIPSNVRPPFLHRPWILNKLYDQYARPSILHCDAYVLRTGKLEYLWIDWREGGHKRIALDAYLIEDDGLTPVWDAERLWDTGSPVFWTLANSTRMAAIHARVLAQAAEAEKLGRYARVLVQAHYVVARDAESGIEAANKYPAKPPPAGVKPPTMAELHAKPAAIGKRRGRPRKPIRILPDWL